jgi:low temperature requirement protein LtrA
MFSWAATLQRKPGEPHQVTFLDLFFDLAFILALFQLSHGLLSSLHWSDVFQTAVLLVAVWSLWTQTAGITDRYDPGRAAIQLLVIGSTFGAVVVAVAVPDAFGARGLVFAAAYVGVQVGRSVFLVFVTRGGGRRSEERLLFWYGLSALPWLAGAFVHVWTRGVLWALAAAVDYASPGLGAPIPRLGRVRPEEFTISGEHVAERHQQFVIIGLGEVIAATGLAVARSSFAAEHKAAAVIAFATTALLWRIYIYRTGELLATAITAASNPLRVAVSAVYAHPFIIAGLVLISAGDELAVTRPTGHTGLAWIAVILGGAAMFLAGWTVMRRAVFGRVALHHVLGILVLAAVSPVMILAPPLLVALTAAVVLAGVAVADEVRARRHPGEQPSPRLGRPSARHRASRRVPMRQLCTVGSATLTYRGPHPATRARNPR